jgi:hypothetical protein
VFKPWDNRAKPIFEYMKEKELAPSGKFREKDIGKFCSEDETFFNMLAHLLTIIEDDEIEEEQKETPKKETSSKSTKETKTKSKPTKSKGSVNISENVEEEKSQPSKPKGKGSDVKVTEIT